MKIILYPLKDTILLTSNHVSSQNYWNLLVNSHKTRVVTSSNDIDYSEQVLAWNIQTERFALRERMRNLWNPWNAVLHFIESVPISLLITSKPCIGQNWRAKFRIRVVTCYVSARPFYRTAAAAAAIDPIR